MDLLRWPVVGRALRWRHGRTSMQLVLLALAVIVVLHGLFGPEIASSNLSTVLVWVHYRGLLAVALLAIGNVFCAGCPFIRVRDWGRLIHAPRVSWPKWLRGKWVALLLFVAVLFTYELFDLWSLPRATAWLVLAYFGGALAIDLVFTGATFCKHLCPIGQFNFVASTLSPLELRVRDAGTCGACRTEDCIAGHRAAPPPAPIVQRGCELGLFLPSKVGNLDCTFCLDCVQACPHDNIAIASRTPGLELTDTRRRSAIGRLVDRPDLAALVLVFVFGALVNAFAMVTPVRGVEQWLSRALGTRSETVVLGAIFLVALGIAPLVLVGAAALATKTLTGDRARSIGQIVMRYVYGLAPFGFGAWLAHYAFHLLTGILVVVPVVQTAAIDMAGRAVFGEPLWRWAGMRPGHVFPIQMGLVLLGTIGSLGVLSLIASQDDPDRAELAVAPWAVVVLALCAFAIWVMYQPMEMRGLGVGG